MLQVHSRVEEWRCRPVAPYDTASRFVGWLSQIASAVVCIQWAVAVALQLVESMVRVCAYVWVVLANAALAEPRGLNNNNNAII